MPFPRNVFARSALWILVGIVSGLASATMAVAQPVATTFDELRAAVGRATMVEVTRGDGTRIKGSIQEIARGRLRLTVDGRALEIEEADVRRLQRRRSDSLLDGLIVGAASGALVGLIPDYYDDCEECHDSLYLSTALGAGVGLLIDAIFRGRQTLYESPTGAALRVDPTVSPRGGAGVAATLRWR